MRPRQEERGRRGQRWRGKTWIHEAQMEKPSSSCQIPPLDALAGLPYPKGRPWGECWFLFTQDDRHTGDEDPTGSAVRIHGSAVVHEGQECPTCLLLRGHSSSIPFPFRFPSAREPDPRLRWGGHIS